MNSFLLWCSFLCQFIFGQNEIKQHWIDLLEVCWESYPMSFFPHLLYLDHLFSWFGNISNPLWMFDPKVILLFPNCVRNTTAVIWGHVLVCIILNQHGRICFCRISITCRILHFVFEYVQSRDQVAKHGTQMIKHPFYGFLEWRNFGQKI